MKKENENQRIEPWQEEMYRQWAKSQRSKYFPLVELLEENNRLLNRLILLLESQVPIVPKGHDLATTKHE